jgi:hypothetical protein
MALALEVRFRELLVAVRGHDGRVQSDARHDLQNPVRDTNRRQRPSLRPRVPPRLLIAAVTLRRVRSPPAAASFSARHAANLGGRIHILGASLVPASTQRTFTQP